MCQVYALRHMSTNSCTACHVSSLILTPGCQPTRNMFFRGINFVDALLACWGFHSMRSPVLLTLGHTYVDSSYLLRMVRARTSSSSHFLPYDRDTDDLQVPTNEVMVAGQSLAVYQATFRRADLGEHLFFAGHISCIWSWTPLLAIYAPPCISYSLLICIMYVRLRALISAK